MSRRKLVNPSDELMGSADVSELIAVRAHEIFQARGGEHGRHLDDWLQAEQDVRASSRDGEISSSGTEQQVAATSQAANEFQGSE